MVLPGRCRERRLRIERLGRVGLDRLEHRDPRRPIAVRRLGLQDQALVEKRAEAADGIQLRAGRLVEVGRHRLDRLDRAATEDRQQLEEPLLGGAQELVAPLDRRAQRLLPLGQIAGAAAEVLEAAAESIPERLRREEVQARGGELDRQRQPVEPATDLGHGGGVVVREAEVGPDAARPLHEQLDGLELVELVRRRLTMGLRDRQRQRRHRDDVLASDPECLPARHEQLQAGAVRQQLDDRGRRDRDLLEVVEDEQDLLGAELPPELVERRSIDRVGDPDGRGRQREDGIGIGCGDEVDEVDAVGEPVDLVRGGPDREPRLAGPTGPRERDQADIVVVEALADRLELGVAADERRRLGREVVRPEVERGEWRELRRQDRVRDLEDPLRPSQVLESMLTQIAQRDAVRQLAADERRGRVRQQDLAAMTGRHDPRRPIDGGPEVIAAARLGLARVDPDPDPDGARLRPLRRDEPALGRDRRGDGRDRLREDGHDPVAGGLDDLAARVGDRGTDDRVVLREGGAHRQRVLLPQAGAALDVGEEECQRRFGQGDRGAVNGRLRERALR